MNNCYKLLIRDIIDMNEITLEFIALFPLLELYFATSNKLSKLL